MIIIRFFIARAEAAVLRHLVLSVLGLAVRAGPVVESHEAFDGAFRHFLFLTLLITVILYNTSLLFLFILANSVLKRLVELLDPTLDAAEMERLATLLAAPNGASLVDGVLADQTFLCTLGKRLNQVLTLLR